jgi:hypothetical protein
VVVVLLPPAEVSHLEAVAEILMRGLPGSLTQHAPLQGAFRLLPAVAHELYPEHDPVLFLRAAVLPLQLKIPNKVIKLNIQCLHGQLFTAINFSPQALIKLYIIRA